MLNPSSREQLDTNMVLSPKEKGDTRTIPITLGLRDLHMPGERTLPKQAHQELASVLPTIGLESEPQAMRRCNVEHRPCSVE